MRRTTTLITTLLACQSAPAAAHEPTDFAHGVEIVTDSAAKLQTLTLPSQIITHLTSRDFADACLFDAHGQQVPHALYLPEEETELVALPVTLYPIVAGSDRKGPVTLTVERDADGGIVRAITQSTDATPEPSVAFLIDRSEIAHPVEQMTLQVQTASAPMLRVAVDAADDLGDFREVTRSTLTHLARSDGTLTVDFPIPNAQGRYLRLSFLQPPSDLTLQRVYLQTRKLVVLPRQTIDLSPLPAADRPPNVFHFTAPVAVRPDRYLLQLPSGTTLIEAALSSSDVEPGSYRPRITRIFARGEDALQPLEAAHDRYFDLRVSDKGGGIHAGKPSLRLGFLPLTLSFLAEGKATYLLAYGSAHARCEHFTAAALRSQVGDAAQGVPTIGQTRKLGGDAALQPAPPPVPYRVYALWTILLFAVALLAVIARKLLKQS